MSKAIIYHKIPVDLLIIIVLFSHSIVSKYVLPASVAETDSAANSRVGPAADADLGMRRTDAILPVMHTDGSTSSEGTVAGVVQRLRTHMDKTQLTQIGAQVEATIKQGAEEANQRIREGFRGIKEKITEVLNSSSR